MRLIRLFMVLCVLVLVQWRKNRFSESLSNFMQQSDHWPAFVTSVIDRSPLNRKIQNEIIDTIYQIDDWIKIYDSFFVVWL